MDHLHVYIEVSGLKLEVIGNYWHGRRRAGIAGRAGKRRD